MLDASNDMLGHSGHVPPTAWISSYVAGSPAIRVDDHDEGRDTEWMALPQPARPCGRSRCANRGREQRRVVALAHIADRWSVTFGNARSAPVAEADVA
ncbi:MAG: hypothetical protein R2706_05810 [Acidimicrobiales bacterium]